MNLAVVTVGVGVRRGGRQVLEGVDWQVAPGTVCGVVGPSGCGKTTLLRSVIGAQRFTGRLSVLGRRRVRPACDAGSVTSRSPPPWTTT